MGCQQGKYVNRLVIDVSEGVIKLIWPHPTATIKKKNHSSSRNTSDYILDWSYLKVLVHCKFGSKLTKEHRNAEYMIYDIFLKL